MADITSELPIRTQLPGQVGFDDVVIKVADGTTSTQLAAVDTHGSQQSTIADAGGNVVTSQANGGQRALDVGIDVGGVQVDPRAIRALTSADVVTANQGAPNTDANGWPVKVTDGTNELSITAAGEAKVDITQPLPAGTNTIGSVGVTNLPATVDTNYGTVGASTLRSAAQIGNATGAANFGNGATGAQTLRTAANLAVGGADVSGTNPVPVSFSSAPLGTAINDYKLAPAVAAAASDNHDYTITSLKTFQGKKIWASASGLMKIEVQVSPNGLAFSTLWVGFNSTATPNITVDMDEMVFLESGVGSKIRVICTNLDNKAQNLYSTISGTEV
jgi:hypothetical protein